MSFLENIKHLASLAKEIRRMDRVKTAMFMVLALGLPVSMRLPEVIDALHTAGIV